MSDTPCLNFLYSFPSAFDFNDFAFLFSDDERLKFYKNCENEIEEIKKKTEKIKKLNEEKDKKIQELENEIEKFNQ